MNWRERKKEEEVTIITEEGGGGGETEALTRLILSLVLIYYTRHIRRGANAIHSRSHRFML